MIDNQALAPAADTAAPSRESLAGMFAAELDAESAPPAPRQEPAAAPETQQDAAPTEPAAPSEISAELTAETTEAADPAQQEPDKPTVSVPSGMSETDKAAFAKLSPELQAWVSKREAETRSDYTRKTQEVAEQRKAVEYGVQAVQQKLAQYDAILSRFTQTDVAPPDPALRNTDPLAFEDQMANYVQAKHAQEVASREQAKVRAEHERIAKAQVEAYQAEQWQELQRLAPTVGADALIDRTEKGAAARKAVFEYGTKQGYSKEQLNGAGALDMLTLYKAQQFDAMKAASKNAKPVPAAAPKVSQPGPAKAIGRPTNLAVAIQETARTGSRESLAAAFLAQLNSEKH